MDFLPVIIHSLNLAIKKNLSSCPQRHLGDQAFGKEKWSSNCLAAQEINDFPTQGWATGCSCWAQSHSFPFLPVKLLCTWRKQNLCYTCRTHTPLPLNPDLSRGLRQWATQFRVYIQKGKECGGVLGELLDTRVSGYKVGNKNTTELSSSQSSWVDKGFNWTMPT